MNVQHLTRVTGTMVALVLICNQGVGAVATEAIVDFTDPREPERWIIVNDGVMGGLSASRLAVTADGTALFAGEVSLENNGGFASVRRQPTDLDLAGTAGIVLRVRGDGRTYQFRARTNERFDGVAYRTTFETEIDRWLTVRLPFADFQPTFRGRPVPEAPPLAPEAIRQIGFLIADKRSGPFQLEIGSIEVWRTGPGEDVD